VPPALFVFGLVALTADNISYQIVIGMLRARCLGCWEMRCPSCNAENQPTAKFCVECGAAFQPLCVKCGFKNPPTAKFCQECGASLKLGSVSQPQVATPPTRLGKPTVDERPPLESDDTPEGERKTVTALFADIKGSTELMRDLDPEEARAVIDPVLQLMMLAVHSYDGYVVQSAGDGIFALFGAPVSHEDHPQRAVHAAIAMRDTLSRRAGDPPSRPAVEVRIGINTGEVVLRLVHTGGHTEYTPVGHAVNLAARMQSVALAGGIVISQDTQRLVEGYFELHELGPTKVKGIEEPINVYEVIDAGPLHGHFELALRRGLTKFVGREREIAEVKRALELARSGRGQIVAVVAEAGTGKSRLFHEFKAKLPPECKVFEAYTVPHGKASAWLPVLELLRDYFAIQDADDAATRREKIRAALNALDPALSDVPPYLWNLLAIQEQPDPLAQMDPRVRRQRTLEAIKRIFLRESLKQPTVVIFEDLHWIDSESQALLDLLADSIAGGRLLLLVNYRPEYRHEWSSWSHYLQLRLDPLGVEKASAMLAALLGEGAELDALRRLVAERTGGNPFFIEEMVQALFEQGILARNGAVKLVRPPAEAHLPVTVQAVLAARIDRLAAQDKDLLQTLAVIGNEFRFALAIRVTQRPDEALRHGLANLRLGEFIYEQPLLTDIEYSFKHALTHEVAYNSLLTQRRKLLHERTGQALESMFAEHLDDHLGELARHYQRSGNTPKAIEYLQHAGAQAAARSAHAGAIGLFTSALELLKSMPETPGRMQQELVLQRALGSALSAIKGLSAPETGQAFERASELCRQLGAAPHLFAVLIGLSIFYRVRAELHRAHELAQQAAAIAELECDAVSLVEANLILGVALLLLGDLAGAQSYWERAIAVPEPAHPGSYHTPYDPRIIASCWAAFATLYLGYPDQALVKSREVLASARKLSHPFTLVGVVELFGFFHRLRGEGEESLALYGEVLRLANEHGFQQYVALALMGRGSALIEMNRTEEGIALLREGLSAVRVTGMYQYQTAYLAQLAVGCCKAGQTAEGLAAVAEGLAAADRTGERVSEAELYRVKGDLLMQATPGAPNAAAEAESCFRQAIEIARHQQAKWWELRATTSLARLLAKQHRRDEVCAMLAKIYDWFTEGFDTADLKDAKALLDELNG
jgi:class 3 adenylate cyclase/tetratricopeptide (TPR) repeat protein/ribosomal protein L40E